MHPLMFIRSMLRYVSIAAWHIGKISPLPRQGKWPVIITSQGEHQGPMNMFKKNPCLSYSVLIVLCILSFRLTSHFHAHDEAYTPTAKNTREEKKYKPSVGGSFINKTRHKVACKCLPFLCQYDGVDTHSPRLTTVSPPAIVQPDGGSVHGIDECKDSSHATP